MAPGHSIRRRQLDAGQRPKDGVMSPNGVFSYSLSISCMHCENPVCMEGCPAGGITKREEDGIVIINTDDCIGCRYCEWTCPYGAPQYDAEQGVMTKCDFCVDLLDAGQNPACVDACVMRCLKYGDLDELRAEYGGVSAVEPLPEASYDGTGHRHHATPPRADERLRQRSDRKSAGGVVK